MKKLTSNTQIRFNLHLTEAQTAEIRRLFKVGLTISAIARQSIRKCREMQLLPDDNDVRRERFNLYLDPSDAEQLAVVAARENCSRSQALRQLVVTYLTTNKDAIERLF